MLLVETNHSKQQSSLQEEFSREGNLFAVPVKKTNQITNLLETILFEIFGQSNAISQSKVKNDHPLAPLVDKIKKLCENMFKLTFSLSSVREILQIIKIQSLKIKLYQDYIMEMNRHFMMGDDADDVLERKQVQQLLTLEHQFQDQMEKNLNSRGVLDFDFANLDCRIDAETQQSGNSDKKDTRNSIISIQCKFNTYQDQDAQTMHTLKSQMTSSPKFSLTPLTQLKYQGNESRENYKQHHSLQCFDQQIEQSQFINVADECKIDKNTINSILYFPQWKKSEEDQKKMVKSLMPPQVKKKSSNQSSFIQNLSGRVHPMPSFLHDESISQMIVKEKKEDVRKSNILKKSMQGVDEKKNTAADHAYSSNLRLVKFHNKLRRNSKKSLYAKKEMQQIKQQIITEDKQTQMSQHGSKILSSARHSDDKLFRLKQRLPELQINNQSKIVNAKMEQIIQAKVKSKKQQLKKVSGDIKPVTTIKGFNFFKANNRQ